MIKFIPWSMWSQYWCHVLTSVNNTHWVERPKGLTDLVWMEEPTWYVTIIVSTFEQGGFLGIQIYQGTTVKHSIFVVGHLMYAMMSARPSITFALGLFGYARATKVRCIGK